MKKRILLIVLILAASAFGRIIHVPEDYSTIQAGINASIDGDTVLVAPETYQEIIQITGKQIMLTSSNGPYETTIFGHIYISGFVDTASCTVQGFNQIGMDRNPFRGQGGIIIYDGKPRIIGNIISNNLHYCFGGGIDSRSRYAVIRDNIIEDNQVYGEVGGIEILYSALDVEISNNIIRNNGSYGAEGAISGGVLSRGGAGIFNNLIYDNSAVGYLPICGKGGGIRSLGGDEIYNNTIVRNYVNRFLDGPGDGSGIYACTGIVKNNIIAFNRQGGLFLECQNDEERYNLIFGNANYDIIAPETSATDIFLDPQFVDTLSNDFHLLPTSPCIDAGDPSFPLDPDSTRADIGALFFDQSVGIDDDNSPSGPYSFELYQNYPNPFNAQTTISYNLPRASRVSLRIYDLTGRVVKRLIRNEYQSAGPHRLIWDAADESGNPVATAIYLYELKVEKQKQVKAMITIR